MALKIRLRQQGRANRTSYRLVVADVRSPRDGKYVEAVGWYNPIEKEDDKILFIKEERIKHWLNVGAQLTEKAACLVAQRAPDIIRDQTEKTVAKKAKKASKRKESK